MLFTMSCGPMEAGHWKLTVEKETAENPYVYEVDMIFLHLDGEMSSLGAEPDLKELDLLQGAWTVDSVAQLPLPDFYLGRRGARYGGWRGNVRSDARGNRGGRSYASGPRTQQWPSATLLQG